MGVALQKPVTPNEFHFAVLIITALAYLISFLYVSFPESKWLKWAFTGFLGAMIINAVFPHLLASILTKTYAPGVGTAILVNIPINTVILYRLHRAKHISRKEILLSTIAMGVLLLALIPVLFMLGDSFINY
jgi:Protein of unknown function with HXXEE motif